MWNALALVGSSAPTWKATRSDCGVVTRSRLMSEPAIRARGLTKSVGGGAKRRTILAGVDLDAAEGELQVIAGRSGSGKTTLMGIVGGLLAQDEGQGGLLLRRLCVLDDR